MSLYLVVVVSVAATVVKVVVVTVVVDVGSAVAAIVYQSKQCLHFLLSLD